MRTPAVAQISTLPTAHEPGLHKNCGRRVHTGPCPQCQRTQLARWARQLAEVVRDRTPQCRGEDPGQRAMRASGIDGRI
jgi:hypothetical protein